MTRAMYAAVSACLLLLLMAVAAGQRWFTTEPQRGNSNSRQVTPATEPQRDSSNSRQTTPAGDSILIVNPWVRQQYPLLRGKVLLPERIDTPHTDGDAGQAPFVGPQACAECHRGKFQGFLRTSHARTSQLANADTIMGSSQAPRNRLATRERRLHFRMDPRPDGLYQTAVVDGRDVHGERMDVIVGSGKVGQSYLYWRDDELFQLPVSYFTSQDSWMNSPGYPDGTASFKRPIVTRCLECHTTWFDARSDEPLNYQYAPEGFLLGVTCERCHGPGDKHVAYHQTHPDDLQAQQVVHPGRLPRDRLFDVCGQCHGGAGLPIRPSFSFRPGNVLTDYVEPPVETASRPGVHSNDQIQRLRTSRCFRQSPQMSCVTCHDPHQFERGNNTLFAIRCQQCHEVADCALEPQIGSALGDHCAQCHMPRTPLVDIGLKSEDGVVFPEMIDHYIRTGVSDRKLEEQLLAAAGNK